MNNLSNDVNKSEIYESFLTNSKKHLLTTQNILKSLFFSFF